jgi:hypothetical protein
LFDWRFKTNGTVVWDGVIAWAGGHAWYVNISNVTLVPIISLGIARADRNTLQLSWPTNFPPYVLEYTTNLPAWDWIAVTNTGTVVADRWVVTLDIATPNRFYRLRKP